MADLLVELLKTADLVEKDRTVFGVTDVGFFHLMAEITDFFLKGAEQVVDVGLVLFCEAMGLVIQDFIGKVLEIQTHLFLGIPEDAHFFICLFPGLVEQGLKPGGLDLQIGGLTDLFVQFCFEPGMIRIITYLV